MGLAGESREEGGSFKQEMINGAHLQGALPSRISTYVS